MEVIGRDWRAELDLALKFARAELLRQNSSSFPAGHVM
jgi:hypothetical protein